MHGQVYVGEGFLDVGSLAVRDAAAIRERHTDVGRRRSHGLALESHDSDFRQIARYFIIVPQLPRRED